LVGDFEVIEIFYNTIMESKNAIFFKDIID